MTAVRVSPSWLALREPADAAARVAGLVDELRRDLPVRGPLVVHDLACGSGSMLRWLAPELPGPQRWVCHDLDADLLELTARERDVRCADGSAVGVEVRRHDVTRLEPDECAGADLITTSALLDLLTADELERLVANSVTARCPVLLTLSVTGTVLLSPAHRLDGELAAAFNAHQQRTTSGRALLGPAAADFAAEAFGRAGCDVLAQGSPWRLGAAQRGLTRDWLDGWIAAACEQRAELTAEAPEYARLRHAQAAAGRLRVVVQHVDLLVRPPDRVTG